MELLLGISTDPALLPVLGSEIGLGHRLGENKEQLQLPCRSSGSPDSCRTQNPWGAILAAPTSNGCMATSDHQPSSTDPPEQLPAVPQMFSRAGARFSCLAAQVCVPAVLGSSGWGWAGLIPLPVPSPAAAAVAGQECCCLQS